jgi:hypothetical protein
VRYVGGEVSCQDPDLDSGVVDPDPDPHSYDIAYFDRSFRRFA